MSINKVILVGNVGKDPEVRYLDNNLAMARFSIATTERGFTSKTGQVIPDKTEWHSVVVWRKLAEIVEKYVKKGSQVYVEGKLRNRSYDDKDGVKRYVSEIQVDVLQMLGRRGDGEQNQSLNRDASGAGQHSGQQQSSQPQFESSQKPATPLYNAQFQPQSMPQINTNIPLPTANDAQFPPHSESFLGMDEMDDLPF